VTPGPDQPVRPRNGEAPAPGTTGARRKPRILLFEPYPHAFAGSQRISVLLLEGLQRRGWPVAAAVPGPGRFVDALRDAGIPVSVWRLPRSLSVYGRRTTGSTAVAAAVNLPFLWLRLSATLRREADIVHIVDHRGQVLVGPAARLAGRTVVWHVHCGSASLNERRFLNAFGSALATRVVVPSDASIAGLPGLEGEKISVIPNALPPGAFDVEHRGSVAPLIVSVGRLHPDKGFDTLLRALEVLRPRISGLRCVIAGSAPVGARSYAKQLEALRDSLDLRDVVEFAGELPSVSSLLGRATVYVQASRTETQPLAILEAMAARVPVVCSRVGGVAEMLGNGSRGELVPEGDVGALALAVMRVLQGGSGVERGVVEARRFVEAACSSERMLDRLEQEYSSL
jgi:glycosyltransferase involved in cell wall biosynthesis